EPVAGGRSGQPAHDLGDEHLAAAGSGTEPGGLDDRGAETVALLQDDVAGAQPDPHLPGGRAPVRPALPFQRLLDADRRGHRLRSPGEDRHDAVTEFLDHPPPVGVDDVGHQPVVLATGGLGGVIAQPRPQGGRTHQVREEDDGRRPPARLAHGALGHDEIVRRTRHQRHRLMGATTGSGPALRRPWRAPQEVVHDGDVLGKALHEEDAMEAVEQEVPPPAAMMGLITGYWVSQAVGVVALLGVADELVGGPRGSDEIARAVGADRDALYRVLRMLASVGVFVEAPPGSFGLTPLGETLCSDAPGSVRNFAITETAAGHWLPWGRLYDSVRSGRPMARQALGMELFEWYGQNPEEAGYFNAAMGNLSA